MLLQSCLFNEKNEIKNEIKHLGKVNLNNATIVKTETILFVESLTYPRQTLIVLKFENNEFALEFVNKLNLKKYSNENNVINRNSDILKSEYNGYNLWKFNFNSINKPAYWKTKDNYIYNYANYYLGGNEPVLFFNQTQKRNGKIVCQIQNNICYIMIEELYNPAFHTK